VSIRKLITRDTNIIELYRTNNNYRLLSNKLHIDYSILKIWHSWYKDSNKEYYYFKDFNNDNKRFINELIGEYLAKKISLDSIHYEIAKKDDTYGLASKSFINKKNKYYYMIDLYLPNAPDNLYNLERLKDKCKTDEEYETLLKEIFKMTAIDIYMSQTDRIKSSNIQFRKDRTGLHLAPLYDYEKSFMDPNIAIYKSNLLTLNLYKNEYINEYPYLYELIDNIFEININHVLEEIEDERKILIPNNDKFEYEKFYNIRKKQIKRTR